MRVIGFLIIHKEPVCRINYPIVNCNNKIGVVIITNMFDMEWLNFNDVLHQINNVKRSPIPIPFNIEKQYDINYQEYETS